MNWYDTRTLQPLAPLFVSSVDSGNLLASLWTLQQGRLDRLSQPILQPSLAEGFLDYLRVLAADAVIPRKLVASCERQRNTDALVGLDLSIARNLFRADSRNDRHVKQSARQTQWFAAEAESRLRELQQAVNDYAPWSSPEFAALRNDTTVNLSEMMDNIALKQVPQFIDQLIRQIDWSAAFRGSQTGRLLYDTPS